MKSLLLVLIITTTFLFSCKKEKDEKPTVAKLPSQTIQYRYNDTLVQIHVDSSLSSSDQSLACIKTQATSSAPPDYTFLANSAGSQFIQFSLYTDSLHTYTYTSDRLSQDAPFYGIQGTSAIVATENVLSMFDNTGDHFTVSVSSYHNGLVSGTFEGKLSRSQASEGIIPPPVVLITEGRFTDVHVSY